MRRLYWSCIQILGVKGGLLGGKGGKWGGGNRQKSCELAAVVGAGLDIFFLIFFLQLSTSAAPTPSVRMIGGRQASSQPGSQAKQLVGYMMPPCPL